MVLQADWEFDDYALTMQVYHGTRPIAEQVWTDFVAKTDSFYERVKFDKWVEMKSVRMCGLPREARLVFTLVGRTLTAPQGGAGSGGDAAGGGGGERIARPVKRELCWGALQLFNFER